MVFGFWERREKRLQAKFRKAALRSPEGQEAVRRLMRGERDALFTYQGKQYHISTARGSSAAPTETAAAPTQPQPQPSSPQPQPVAPKSLAPPARAPFRFRM